MADWNKVSRGITNAASRGKEIRGHILHKANDIKQEINKVIDFLTHTQEEMTKREVLQYGTLGMAAAWMEGLDTQMGIAYALELHQHYTHK